ncbi:sensor histidine kinase [Microvirga massiliensis]|uniref:sensor histidine kinase n=1 Tax=Microvirga massiliensis TaxID=1033741 RepID=UPI00062B55A0|nr:sensor histidine kinase [Microvirga massiliensis]
MIERGRSLYSRIILVIAAIFGIGTIALGAAAWFYARIAADDAYDRLLVGAALQIAESIYAQDGIVSVDPPVSAFETLSLSSRDRIFYKVLDPRGSVLTGYDDLAPLQPFTSTEEPIISDGVYKGFPVRIAVVGRQISDPMISGWAQVVVAQTREARTSLARDLTVKALLLVLATTGLAFVGVLFAVRHALEPLARTERELQFRDPKDLNPLDLETPREIQALVSTINRFMDRLAGRIALMQRFIADAAHQIRTPLAGLAPQVDLLSEEERPDRRKQQLERVRERTSELGRLTNQLLSHAMVIHRAEVANFEPIDLAALARQTLISAVPLALDRDVDISFEEPADPVFMCGDAVSIREALSNLIHNALKHGGNTRLEVRVFTDQDAAVIEVVDDGPGIPASEWQRVREPFHTKSSTGSGLGLAIAGDVVRAHGGELRFRERSEDGFAVILRFKRFQGPDELPRVDHPA